MRKGLNCELNPLAGPNGCGKTTFVGRFLKRLAETC
jgi:hypothetical protein